MLILRSFPDGLGLNPVVCLSFRPRGMFRCASLEESSPISSERSELVRVGLCVLVGFCARFPRNGAGFLSGAHIQVSSLVICEDMSSYKIIYSGNSRSAGVGRK